MRVSATAVRPIHVGARETPVSASMRAARAVCVFLTVAAFASGAYMRCWYLFHRPLTSDEAVTGLMARHILHGHFFAFLWGQQYGGAEPYVTAAGFGIFGTSAWVLKAIPLLLSLAAALVAWRVAKRLVNDAVLALLVGAIVWAVPVSTGFNSSIETGFRGVTLLCGLVILLLVLRMLDGRDQWWAYGLLGLFAGVGWWSSPEIVYFVVPAGLILLAVVWSSRGEARSLATRLAVLIFSLGVGALPWLWSNANSGFKSLKTSSFPAPADAVGYHGRLDRFFHYSLGMLFSLRNLFNGHWLGGRTTGEALLVAVLVVLGASSVLAVLRGGRVAAVAVGVVSFPFILAISPASSQWQTGRYIGAVVPLYVMVLAIGTFTLERVASSRMRSAPPLDVASPAGRFGLSLVGGFLIAMTLLSFVKDPFPGVSVSSAWGDPNKPAATAIHDLERGGVRYGYASYEVAYRLDLLSKEHLTITVRPGDLDRWLSYTRQVAAHPRAAWIFVRATAGARAQWNGVSGPGGLTESQFTGQLKAAAIDYTVVGAGTLDAVIPRSPVDANSFSVGR